MFIRHFSSQALVFILAFFTNGVCVFDAQALAPLADLEIVRLEAVSEINESTRPLIVRFINDQPELKPSSKENILQWLDPSFKAVQEEGKDAHQVILTLLKNSQWKELDDRFYKKIEPGTAGMRGPLGVGSVRINEATIGMFAQAHANYMKNHRIPGRRGIVIGGDSRRGSYDPETGGPGYLQKMVAEIYAAAGIPVYLSDKPLPTPVVSCSIGEIEFTEGELPEAGAINTASHNPKTDNGYKIYEVGGHQVVTPEFIADLDHEINSVNSFGQVQRVEVPWPGKEELQFLQDASKSEPGKVRQYPVGELIRIASSQDVIEQYTDKVKQLAIRTRDNETSGQEGNFQFTPEILESIKEQKIVITALNGNLWETVKVLFEKHGLIEGVHFFGVEQENVPNGDFPVAVGTKNEGKPNPEYPDVFERAIGKAKKVGARYAFAADPDSDRIGIVYIDPRNGKRTFFNGNEQLAIAADYMTDPSIPAVKAGKVFSKKDTFIKTRVSSDLYSKIIRTTGARLLHVLVGFKYFGQISDFYVGRVLKAEGIARKDYARLSEKERKRVHEKHGVPLFAQGGEESMGMNRGSYVYDKDTPATMALFAEIVGHTGLQGQTFSDPLDKLYRQHGFYKESTYSSRFEGAQGDHLKKNVMNFYRNASVQELNQLGGFGGLKIVAKADYQISARDGVKVNRSIVDEQSREIPIEAGGEVRLRDYPEVVIPSYEVPWDETTPVTLDSSDYLLFYLENGSTIQIRPSGTEPVVKLYRNMLFKAETLDVEKAEQDIAARFRLIEDSFETLTRQIEAQMAQSGSPVTPHSVISAIRKSA